MEVASRRALQAVVTGLGGLAASTGTAALLRGTSLVRGSGDVSADVDSEHRWFAVWWTALGPLLWSITPSIERQERVVRAVAATCFAGGCARLLSARQVGPPQPLYRALTAVELVLPAVLVEWQRRVAREA